MLLAGTAIAETYHYQPDEDVVGNISIHTVQDGDIFYS